MTTHSLESMDRTRAIDRAPWSREPLTSESSHAFTLLLRQLEEGDPQAAENLFTLIYDELHRIAQGQIGDGHAAPTLQATALVNETYLKLFGAGVPTCKDRHHFLAFAAKAMRCVLIDHVRSRRRAKRQPKGDRIPLEELARSYEKRAVDLITLDDALNELCAVDETMVKIVELRFFGGLSMKETAAVLELPLRTVEREWQAARAWLRRAVE